MGIAIRLLRALISSLKTLHGSMAMCAPIHMPGEYAAAIREERRE